MGTERDDRVVKLFLRACDLPEDRRATFLDRECRDDPELRAEVESLLGHDREASGGGGTDLLRRRSAEVSRAPDRPGPSKTMMHRFETQTALIPP